MGTLRLPPKIIAQLDKIRRHCLWNKKTDTGEKCNSLAAWPMVRRPKKSGGLGILDLHVQNDALLLKLLHKFYNQHGTPWVNLIWNTYYTDIVPHATEPCDSFWWRDLIQLMPIYQGVTQTNVRNGTTALFWKDDWNHSIYEEKYPRAFSYCKNGDILIQAFLNTSDLATTFHLPLSVQAHDELRQIQREVATVELTNENDTWTYYWGAHSFKTTSYYSYYFKEIKAHVAFNWLWKTKCTQK